MNQSNISLVIGAEGMIGGAMGRRLLHLGEPVVRTTRVPEVHAIALDLSSDVAAWTPPCGVAAAYLCAAVASVDACRRDPAGTFAVNVTATVTLAQALVGCGAWIVFPSTNLVFDGSVPFPRAESPVAPATEYGRQKAEAEKRLMALCERMCVVRFAKVLGPHNALLSAWADELRSGRAIHPFGDMRMAPVPLDCAVDVLLRVGRERLRGFLQVSGPEDVSYEAVARHVARRVGAPASLVKPIQTAASGLELEHVPLHTTLDLSRLRDELGMAPPDVWTTIDGAL